MQLVYYGNNFYICVTFQNLTLPITEQKYDFLAYV
ncbi:hypothetical protein SAMN05421855_101234 [Ulvibacter litoralis]|uniref:Uncharacterized protein n=1 Tax=Ulvibacter litoralis TaxID=227084 RepID=A0A1G7C9J8_9FLAO|nr:hypothetical protein SAMN05421855_101234 [Ulvibacter litoralis]